MAYKCRQCGRSGATDEMNAMCKKCYKMSEKILANLDKYGRQ